MINLGSTLGKDSTLVALPMCISSNSHRDRLFRQISSKIFVVVEDPCSLDISVSSVLGLTGVDLASSILCSVRIVGFTDETMVFDILETVVHETAIATLVSIAGRAINKLLLRKQEALVMIDTIARFNSSSG